MTTPENCWLIFISPTTVAVGLYQSDTSPQLPNQAVGTEIVWDPADPQSLVDAASTSLESAALTIQIGESQEPSQAIFIVPPFWVENGALFPRFKTLLEPVLRNLKLKPLGFLAQDELAAEALSKTPDGQPSFVFISLIPSGFSLSLISFGQNQYLLPSINYLPTEFIPTLEKALFQLKSNYAIPPKIIIFGSKDNQLQANLADYRWQNPSFPDIFLQLPEIKFWHYTEFLELFHYLVGMPSSASSLDVNSPDSETKSLLPLPLSQIAATDMGFATDISPPPPEVSFIPVHQSPPPPILSDSPSVPNQPVSHHSRFKLSIPTINLPQIDHPLRMAFLPLVALIIALVFFVVFPKVDITVFITPMPYKQSAIVAINQPASGSQLGIITTIVTQDLQVSASIPTTGNKVTGQKAKGEAIIFNKSDKAVNLPKGTQLSAGSSKNYELLNPVQVPAAAANFDRGIIEMGQTKVAIGAVTFGPEYNLTGSQDYKITDYPELVARSTSDISGGTKQDIKVVASSDKTRLNSEIDAAIKKQLVHLTASQKDPLIITNSSFVYNKKIDINREVGEEANELSATAKLSVSFHQLPLTEKKKLVDSLVSQMSTENQLKYLVDNFSVGFTTPPTSKTYVGSIGIEGWLEPRVSSAGLASKLVLKSTSSLPEVLKTEVSRFYDWEITSRLGYIKVIPLLPAMASQINLTFKVK